MDGKKFGKWTVLKEISTTRHGKYYDCLCECGAIKQIPGVTLRAGRSTQCRECKIKMLHDPQKMIGQKFGNWTIIRFVDVYKKSQRFETVCLCGSKGLHIASDLKRKRSQRCWDCHMKRASERNKKHGMHKDPVYKVWTTMIQRCTNPNAPRYDRYGGRGITVCERWINSFQNFLDDMGPRPKGKVIDRINNNGNYEPGNCRWITQKENLLNRGY